MTLRDKILIPIASLLLILLFIFGYLFVTLQAVKEHIKRETLLAQELTDKSINLGTQHKHIHNSILLYLLNGDKNSVKYLDEYRSQIYQSIQEMKGSVPSPKLQDMLTKYENLINSSLEEETKLVNSDWNKDNTLQPLFATWQLKNEYIDALVNDMISYNISQLERNTLLFESNIKKISVAGAVSAGIALGIVSLLGLLLRDMVTKPIKTLSKMAVRMTSGDFSTTKIANKRGDEIGQLGSALNLMSKKLYQYYAHLQHEVEQSNRALRIKERLEKQKDDFIAMASHELKTPITSQKAFLQLLERRFKQNRLEEYLVYTDKINDQTDKLIRLINDLLDVSKITAGTFRIKRERFDFSQSLQEVIEEIRISNATHKIEYHCNGPIYVYADRHRIQQVLNNLMTNAIKYSPNANRVSVKYGQVHKNLEVRIKDYGIGIDEKHQGKIFKRFYRVNGTSEKMFSGMGIGLNISAEIIKLHKGRIGVDSKVGQGSEFTFTIPLQN